jgi:hypothetical protein
MTKNNFFSLKAKILRRQVNIAFVVLLGFTLSSCMTSYYYVKPSTHFAYPNANVISNNKQLKANKTKFGFLFPPVVKGEDERDVINKALALDPEADMLLNAGFNWRVIMILGYFNFGTLTVEGESAKQVIGKQNLNH